MALLNGRVDSGALPLAVGDLLAILGVMTIGMIRHGTFGPERAVLVYSPFVIGWVIGAVLIGAYSAGAAESAKAAIPLGVRAWVLATFIGLGLRWTVVFPDSFQLDAETGIFIMITLVLTGVLLGGFRWLFFKVVA